MAGNGVTIDDNKFMLFSLLVPNTFTEAIHHCPTAPDNAHAMRIGKEEGKGKKIKTEKPQL
jgi:hypothetical protein